MGGYGIHTVEITLRRAEDEPPDAIRLIIAPDAHSLARTAAEHFVALAAEAIEQRGRFVAALAGGSTPRPTYALLGEAPIGSSIDWSRTHICWGDERCVSPDHADSNYRMVREALLDHVDIPVGNVHRIRGELGAAQAAAAYRAELNELLGQDGRFDLILLGMGGDGHTASLFPGATALEARQRTVVAVYVEKLDAWRVTLTLPVINNARHATFIISGADKADVVQAVLAEPDRRLPAQQIRPTSGRLTWLLDTAAARKS